MEKFEVKKVENCFKDSQTYEYALPEENTNERIKSLAKNGDLIIKSNFRRPFFNINYPNGSNAKGIIGDYRIKASFPQESLEKNKDQFENILIDLIKEEENDKKQKRSH